MKKTAGLLAAAVAAFYLAGCQSSRQKQTVSGGYDLYEGYLSVDDDQLFVNDFKFIDLADQYWIRKLELTAEDMPDGYYIYDTSDELLTFTLSEETRYNFYDVGARFVPEDDKDRLYTTTNLADFLSQFDSDGDGSLNKTPFEIQVLEDGRVLSISEIFVNQELSHTHKAIYLQFPSINNRKQVSKLRMERKYMDKSQAVYAAGCNLSRKTAWDFMFHSSQKNTELQIR